MKAFVLALGLSVVAGAEPMLVTDCSGDAGVRLLQKLPDRSVLDVKKGARVTLSSLTDGSRVTLQGPVKVRLDTPLSLLQGKPSQLQRQAGRKAGTGPPRNVSLTMGGELVRSDSKGLLVQSAGQLLRPVVRWKPHEEASLYRVELLQGEQSALSREVEATEVTLPLEAGRRYLVRVTALAPDSATDRLVPVASRQAPVWLMDSAPAEQFRQRSERLMSTYRRNPQDLSPIMILVSEYLDEKLYSEALDLLAQLPQRPQVLELGRSIQAAVRAENAAP